MVLGTLPKSVGVKLGEDLKIPYLAFADDVVLLGSTRSGLQASLNHLVREAGKIGLEIGVKKCATIGIVAYGKKKTWALHGEPFKASETPLQSLKQRTFYKYLGIQASATDKGTAHQVHQGLVQKLERWHKAPAKPNRRCGVYVPS